MAAAAAIASLYSEAQVAGGLLVGNSENENENHFILLARGGNPVGWRKCINFEMENDLEFTV